jgi:CheY-like chemotaxis protein/rubrerythrin
MGAAPYGDITILYHGIFAFLIPFGWALILYPYWRRHRDEWYKTLIFVAVLSLALMVGKEIYLDQVISSDDIAADLLGVFFGTSLAFFLLALEGRITRPRTRAAGAAVIAHEPETDDGPTDRSESSTAPREISLRDITGVLARLHERGAALYEAAAKGAADPGTRELLTALAAEKRGHAREVASLLAKWPDKAPDVRLLDWMDERIGRQGIFAEPIPPDTSGLRLIEYAAGQEQKIHDLFSSLHDRFQGYSWRTIQYENMILELKGRPRRLEERYRRRVEASSGGDAGAKSPAGRPPEGRDAAIMVVDDEEAIRKAVAEYLRDDGYPDVDIAGDGQEALDLFEKRAYDVVVVDIAMPKQHGIEVLRRIKSVSPGTQVIIMTGRAGKDSAVAALKLGALDYIEKPFDFEVLSQSVAEGIRKSGVKKEKRT